MIYTVRHCSIEQEQQNLTEIEDSGGYLVSAFLSDLEYSKSSEERCEESQHHIAFLVEQQCHGKHEQQQQPDEQVVHGRQHHPSDGFRT